VGGGQKQTEVGGSPDERAGRHSGHRGLELRRDEYVGWPLCLVPQQGPSIGRGRLANHPASPFNARSTCTGRISLGSPAPSGASAVEQIRGEGVDADQGG
jgi:hypothetical protein